MYFRTLVLTGLIVSYISASPADNSLYTARLNSLMQTISETAQPSGGDTITISSAIEEHESFVISIKSKTAQSGISVMPLSGHPGNLDIKYVEFAPLDSLNTRRSPLFLKPYSSPLPSSTAAITYFVITAKSNSRTDTGSFNVKLKVEGGSTACTLNVKWRIRPYSLRQFTDFSCGAFVGSYRTINQATANDMKAHGVDAVQFFLGYGSVYPGIYSSDTSIQVINDNGHLKVEFHAFDSLLKFMKNAGMRGPVTPSIGNDRTAHLERDICMAFPQFKLDTGAIVDGKKAVTGPLNNPVFDTLLTSAIRQFKNKIESYGFEMVLLIYDEPTERLMTQLAYRHPKIKEAFPSMRIYGVTMDMLQWAQQIAPYSDILVSNGSFSSISSYAKTNNKDFWVYQEATSSMSPSQVRESYGIRFAKYKPGAIFFWAYNYYSGNPYTFPDGDETGQTIVFPPSASNGYQPTGSPAWEGLREAHDDWRYVKTLESMLATATGTAAARISTEFNNTKIRITDYGTNRSSMYDSLRTVFAGWINEIIKEEGSKFTDMTIEAEMNIAAAASGKSMMVLTPNPFNPTAKLYIPLSLFGNMLPEVTMHATDGRIVKRIRLTHQANSLTAEIASGDLAAGMYVLRAAAGNKIFTIRAAVIR